MLEHKILKLLFSAAGIGRCKIGNGGCWQETQDGKIYSACLVRAYP